MFIFLKLYNTTSPRCMRSLGLVYETLSVNSNVTPLVKDDEGNRGKFLLRFKYDLEISYYFILYFLNYYFVSYYIPLGRNYLNLENYSKALYKLNIFSI